MQRELAEFKRYFATTLKSIQLFRQPPAPTRNVQHGASGFRSSRAATLLRIIGLSLQISKVLHASLQMHCEFGRGPWQCAA